MELLPPPDLFESFDFNFLTTEVFHPRQNFDDPSSTDGEILQLDWRNEADDKVESSESLIENRICPTLEALDEPDKSNEAEAAATDE